MRTTRIADLIVLTAVAMAVAGAPVPGAWSHPAQSHGRPTEPRAVEAPVGRRVEFEAPAPGTYRLPVIKPAPDGAVLDASGARRRLHQLMAGKVVVLSFVYTQCSDGRGCPLATAVLYQIHQASASDSALAEHLKLITLSFDPAHDTPAVMARYARPRDPSARASEWDRLTTASDRALAPILAGYGQIVSRPTGSQATGLTHRLRVYLIDPQQRIRNIYGLDFLDPQLLLADVRTLLLEEQAGRR
jgi:cytochrome oxidase Cu insertion factor (SCO1/SenC/PrrC family)